jgi:hypothetical protein
MFSGDTEFELPIKYSLNTDVINNKLYFNSYHNYFVLHLFIDSNANPLYVIKFKSYGYLEKHEYLFELDKFNPITKKYEKIIYMSNNSYKRIEDSVEILNMIDDIVLRPTRYNGFESILINNINTKLMISSMKLAFV